MTLFPEVEHLSSAKKRNSERTFDFFTRVCDWPEMEDARNRLELWFSHVPEEEQGRIRQAMSQGGNDQFDACFFEVFLHELLLACGCKPTFHPPLPNRGRVPDFSARAPDGLEFFIEAAVVTDKPDSERTSERRQGQVLDMLNSISSPRFSFAIRELVIKSSEPPSLRSVRQFVQERIAATSAEAATAGPVIWEYEDPRIRLLISPIPHENKTWDTNVGMGPWKFRWGGPEAAITSKLRKKATRYGKLEKPLVVAVNVASEWTNNLECVTTTLLGIPEQTLLRNGGATARRQHHVAKSFWHDREGPRHRTVSAVLATRMFPGSVLRSPLRLYHNPHARHPLPDDALLLEQASRELVIEPGLHLRELLGQ